MILSSFDVDVLLTLINKIQNCSTNIYIVHQAKKYLNFPDPAHGKVTVTLIYWQLQFLHVIPDI